MRSRLLFLVGVFLVAALCARPTIGEAAPTANFQADPRLGEVPLVVHFNNTSTGEGPLTFHWDFGDGQQNTARDPAPHTYLAPGPFEVTLTVGGTTIGDQLTRAGRSWFCARPQRQSGQHG